MDAQKKLIEKLKQREPIVGCGLMNVTHSGVAEVYKNCGMDFVLIDCEHGSLSDVSAEAFMRHCRLLGLPTVMRVPGHHQALVAKPMDMGADGVMVPRVDTLEQLDEIVKHFRFAPRGKKGFGGFAQLHPGEALCEVNDNRILSIQIESREGADNLEAMLQKYPGELQFVLIGPFDLSIDVGTPGETTSQAVLAVVERIADTCARHGVSLGIFCNTPESMAFFRPRGINVLWVSAELFLLQNEVARVKSLFDALPR